MTLPERDVTTPAVSIKSLLEGGTDIGIINSASKLVDYVDEIVESGFPGIRPLKQRVRQAQLDSYLDNIVRKDVREAAQNAPAVGNV